MKIAPSVLTADFTNLQEDLNSISNADYIHIDIMDGHFVPNISFGPAINKQIANATKVPLDIHLMVSNPVQWISDFAVENVEYITVHYESNEYKEAIQLIKSKNIKPGITIKPKTPVSSIVEDLKDVDLVLIMSVEPGFGGQSFMPDMLEKVEELVILREKLGLNYVIEIDGGINNETIKLAEKSGVDICVVGSYLFNQKDRKSTINALR